MIISILLFVLCRILIVSHSQILYQNSGNSFRRFHEFSRDSLLPSRFASVPSGKHDGPSLELVMDLFQNRNSFFGCKCCSRLSPSRTCRIRDGTYRHQERLSAYRRWVRRKFHIVQVSFGIWSKNLYLRQAVL